MMSPLLFSYKLTKYDYYKEEVTYGVVHKWWHGLRGRGQGFCDDSTKDLVVKSVKIEGAGVWICPKFLDVIYGRPLSCKKGHILIQLTFLPWNINHFRLQCSKSKTHSSFLSQLSVFLLYYPVFGQFVFKNTYDNFNLKLLGKYGVLRCVWDSLIKSSTLNDVTLEDEIQSLSCNVIFE